MSTAKARRVAALVARSDELTATVRAGEQARKDAADVARALLAEGMKVPDVAKHSPYSAPWLRNARAELERRGEISE